MLDDLENLRVAMRDKGSVRNGDLTGRSLAARYVLERETPAYVFYGEHRSDVVVWFSVGHRASTWIVERREVPDWIAQSMGSEPCVVGGGGPSLANYTTTYTVLRDGAAEFPFSMSVQELLQREIDAQVQDWLSAERAQWTSAGQWDWQMSLFPPETPPCPEVAAVGRMRDGSVSGPLTFKDIEEDLASIRVVQAVPKDVWGVLNRAAKLYAYGYLEWEFFTMAQHQAVMAIETSLKALYIHQLTHPVLIEQRNGHNSVCRSRSLANGVASYHSLSRLVNDMREERPRVPKGLRLRTLVNDEPFPAKKTDMVDWANRREWLSDNEAEVLRYYFHLRDHWSHPEGPERHWISHVFGSLYDCTVLINRMWSRVSHGDGVIWEHAFQNRPKWAQ